MLGTWLTGSIRNLINNWIHSKGLTAGGLVVRFAKTEKK